MKSEWIIRKIKIKKIIEDEKYSKKQNVTK